MILYTCKQNNLCTICSSFTVHTYTCRFSPSMGAVEAPTSRTKSLRRNTSFDSAFTSSKGSSSLIILLSDVWEKPRTGIMCTLGSSGRIRCSKAWSVEVMIICFAGTFALSISLAISFGKLSHPSHESHGLMSRIMVGRLPLSAARTSPNRGTPTSPALGWLVVLRSSDSSPSAAGLLSSRESKYPLYSSWQTTPVPFVVLSTVSSCIKTTWLSFVKAKSNSTKPTASAPSRTAAIEFSGWVAALPLCPTNRTSTPSGNTTLCCKP
mmetsp:Transcript_56260/g.138162  ORF Transcript_56260/g.138162 Transcript_56260/m.138162 type:complete len:266 (-) Transcript_56260:331-1128(-)